MKRGITFAVLMLCLLRASAGEIPFEAPYSIGYGKDAWAADLDRDGDQDLVVYGFGYVPIFGGYSYSCWLENMGGNAPHFNSRSHFEPVDLPNSACVTDLDRDGDPDVIFGVQNSLYWYQSDGARPPVYTGHPLVVNHSVRQVTAADLNHDGRQDLVGIMGKMDYTSTATQITWFENGGSNPPLLTTHTLSPVSEFFCVQPADLDHDGDMDVIATKRGATVWFENNGSNPPLFTEHPLSSSWVRTTISSADLNGDALLDVVLGYNWCENLGGEPAKFKTHPIDTGFSNPKPETDLVRTGDLNLDGHPDLIGDPAFWLENDGAATPAFTRRKIAAASVGYPPPNGIPYHLAALMDADQDGDLDLLFSQMSGVMSGAFKLFLVKNPTVKAAVKGEVWSCYP